MQYMHDMNELKFKFLPKAENKVVSAEVFCKHAEIPMWGGKAPRWLIVNVWNSTMS